VKTKTGLLLPIATAHDVEHDDWCGVISVATLHSDHLECKEAWLDEIRMCREEKSVRVEELTAHSGCTRQ
jgi:hypothetical protein